MSKKHLTKSTSIIAIITIISRITGLVRTTLISQIFGASAYQDAFIASFEIPNILRRVFGEGSLSSIVVPIFSEEYLKNGKKEAFYFLSNLLNVLSVLMAFVTILFYFLTPFIVRIFLWGYYSRHQKDILDTATLCTRIMLPVMFFLALFALLMGIYNSFKRFALPTFGSIFLNLSMIICCILFFHSPQEKFIIYLSISVTIGMIVRFLSLYIPLFFKDNFRHRFIFKPFDERIKKLFILLIPSFLGMIIAHFNIIVDKVLATYLGIGFSTYLNNANFLIQFPLAIFASAIGTAIIPTVSQNIIKGERKSLNENVTFAIELLFILLLPCFFGYIILRENIIALLFQRQNWDINDTLNTSWALLFYSFGFVFWGLQRVTVSIYYANKDPYTPLKIGAFSMILNIILNIILIQPIFHLSFGGLALATSIATTIGSSALFLKLQKKMDIVLNNRIIYKTIFISFSINIILSFFIIFLKRFFFTDVIKDYKLNVLYTLGSIFIYAVIYLLFIILLHPERNKIIKIILRK